MIETGAKFSSTLPSAVNENDTKEVYTPSKSVLWIKTIDLRRNAEFDNGSN